MISFFINDIGKGRVIVLNHYQVIDEKSWERAMHCMVFRNSVEPAFCVTFEADVTNFLNKVKQHKYSFTLAMVYACLLYTSRCV